MVTCCDYIYILCGDTYIMNVTERHFLAKPEHRKDKDYRHYFCFCFFLCVFFSFHGRL